MEEVKDFIYELKNSEDERISFLQPVNYKYLRWNQIKKYIIPINVDFSDKSIDEAQNIMHDFFQKNCLCRAVLDNDKRLHIKKMITAPIRVYEGTEEEFNKITYSMGERMLNREVYGEILLDCCFFYNDKELVFFGLFSHLITDGQMDIKKMLQEEFDYYSFQKYLQELTGKVLVDFDDYIDHKKILVDKFLSSDMIYCHFKISDSKMMIKKGYTLEELWTLVIVDFIRNKISELSRVPINITSGGRKYGTTEINAFGDFHEDYIFVVGYEEKFLDKFRYYRNLPYLNAKQYNQYLESNNDNNYSEYIEPITISVKWMSEEYTTFQTLRKQILPPHAKNAVIGFNILMEKNLKNVKIDIRTSKKTEHLFDNFEEEIMKYYQLFVGRRN